jgi:hypothetical protein
MISIKKREGMRQWHKAIGEYHTEDSCSSVVLPPDNHAPTVDNHQHLKEPPFDHHFQLMYPLLESTVGSCWDRPSALRSARTLNLTQQTEEEDDEQ